MPDPPSYDHTLLERLNALKKSNIELDQSKPTFKPFARESTSEIDLSARLKSLRNGSLSQASTPSPKVSTPQQPAVSSPRPISPLRDDPDPLTTDLDDKTLEELLADLGPEEQWTLNPDDPEDIRKLLTEAKISLPKDVPKSGAPANTRRLKSDNNIGKPYLTKDLDISVFTSTVDEEEDEDNEKDSKEVDVHEGTRGKGHLINESQEVQDIVRKLMNEVALEGGNDDAETEDTDHDGGFTLPSAPSALPHPSPSKDDDAAFTNDITSRLAALSTNNSPLNLPSAPTLIKDSLGLPSAPTFKPSDKPIPGLAKKKFADEEIDTWCVICQDDATVECLGCDGDLYCANCWKEGHMGPDVEFEEKTHRWNKFRKPN